MSSIQHPLESLGIVHASRGDIRVERLEERATPRVPFPHRHDFFQLVIVTQGEGTHQIDFKKYSIQERQFFSIKPGQVHSWTLSSKTKGYVIEFTKESLAELGPRVLRLSEMAKLKDPLFKALQSICESMVEECLTVRADKFILLQSYLSVLLVYLLRNLSVLEGQGAPSSEGVVEKFKELLEAYYRTEHGIEFYSERLGLSSKALTMRTHRQLGLSAKKIIHERLLLEAKRYLIYTSQSISTIAADLGYQDANYFIRFFREQMGVTPSRYRERGK